MAIIPADEKVFMVSNGTNTTYGGSAALQAMNQWYTMQDVADSVQPYKVFTALLTQSGVDDIQYINWDDDPNTLTIGVTYTITANDNSNFIPNGAPNNNVGTSFIATSSVVAWGTSGNNQVYYNIGAPVATVLENTIGNIFFTYELVGNYGINTNALFNNKTAIFFGPYIDSEVVIRFGAEIQSESFITIGSALSSGLADNIFIFTPIEIRVYN